MSATPQRCNTHTSPPAPKQPHEGKHAPLKFHFLSFALFAGQVSYLLILTSFERLLTHFASISVCFLYRSLHQDKSVPGNERALASNSDKSLIEFNHFDLSLFQYVWDQAIATIYDTARLVNFTSE